MTARDAFETMTARLQALCADEQTAHHVDPGSPKRLVMGCPACNGRGYTERPEEGHLRPRQLCTHCDATGRYATEPGLRILELLALALEPRALVTAEEIAEHNEADAVRYAADLAQREDQHRRSLAVAELERQAALAKAAILRGTEADLGAEPSGELARDLLTRARAGELDRAPEPIAEQPGRKPRPEQQTTVTGSYTRLDGSRVLVGGWPAPSRAEEQPEPIELAEEEQPEPIELVDEAQLRPIPRRPRAHRPPTPRMLAEGNEP